MRTYGLCPYTVLIIHLKPKLIDLEKYKKHVKIAKEDNFELYVNYCKKFLLALFIFLEIWTC